MQFSGEVASKMYIDMIKEQDFIFMLKSQRERLFLIILLHSFGQ